MKFVYTITLLLITLWLGAEKVVAQSASTERVLNQVIESLIDGDADRLSQYFSQKIELTINGSSKFYSKKQALFVLREFFRSNPTVSFSMQHTGSTDRTVFMMGVLFTTKGDHSVNVFIGRDRGEVIELRIK